VNKWAIRALGLIMLAVLAACNFSSAAPTPLPTPVVGNQAPTSPVQPMPSAQSATPLPAEPTIQPAVPNSGQFDIIPFLSGFDRPVALASSQDSSGRLFIVEKVGVIWAARSGQLSPEPFLDISDRVGARANEQGLLGLAFHPDFGQTGAFFVNYTDVNGDTVVSRFSANPQVDVADPATEQVILTVDQPAVNHNGGHLAFGPDGYLYIGLGDGGGADDRYGNGQNTHALLGKMLRIDINGSPYSIPADNPFVNNSDYRPEIWATGLRNPWRYSFDRLTGDLYIADVGQDTYEEIDFQPVGDPGGQNYGWPFTEGMHCAPFNLSGCGQVNLGALTTAVAEYTHSEGGCSVTGGYVYRGQLYPALTGIYFLGDYCSGIVWGLTHSDTGAWQMSQIAQTSVSISTFGEDELGELYIADMAGGVIYQIVTR
jgi:glucose/arabinose dehydrogenase